MADIALENRLRDEIMASAECILSLTQKLVRTPSTSPPGNVSAVALVAADQIRQLIPESDISTIKTGPDIINVVAVIRSGRRGKRLVFSGHMDTYPTGDAGRWTLDPFSGDLSSDGKHVYGRGVSDMKGGIAASIIAARALSRCKESWSGEVVIALAGDEETMGKLGSAHLIKHVAEVGEADAMICGDAGSPIIVRTGEKGLLWLEVEASGKAAHGAHVHRGSNAIDQLMVALSQLKSLEKLEIWPAKEVEDAIAAAKPVSEPLGGPGEAAVLGSITVNIGTISGGTSTNLVAETASASLDIRLPIGLSTATLIEQIKRILEPADGIRHDIVRAYEASWTPPDEEIIRHALGVTRLIVDEQATVNMRVGASDARLFRAAGIPSVVIGLTPHNMGGPDEYVEVAELVQVAQIHALTAYRFLRA